MRSVVLAFIFLGIIVAALRWSVRHVVTQATHSDSDCIQLAGSTTIEDQSRTYISGSIRNDCGRRVLSVTVSFTLDRADRRWEDLPSAPVYAYVRDIQAGEVKQFKTLFPIPDDASYRFDHISAD